MLERRHVAYAGVRKVGRLVVRRGENPPAIVHQTMHEGKQKNSRWLIYFDTSLWNALCDQAVDAERLIIELAEQDFQIGLGTNAVYEMAKTFRMDKPDARERGKELFAYVKQYTDRAIPCLRETRDLLEREAAHAVGDATGVEVHWKDEEYAALREEIKKLADGVFDEKATRFVSRRKMTARNVPDEFRDHLSARPDLCRILEKIPEKELPRWIQRELSGTRGRRALQGHLALVFRRKPDRQLTHLAKRLLAGARYKAAHAVVRSDLYLNWRYAQRGSLRRDLPDDTYHGVNACYCESFVTTEADQAEHVAYTNPRMVTAVYTGAAPLGSWLTQVIVS